MAKKWVLDTETKGTGAHIAPLPDVPAEPHRKPELSLVELRRAVAPAPAPAQPDPLRFKLVDVMSAEVLGENVGARAAVELLEGTRSVLDTRVSVWVPSTGRWRLLGLDEQKALWSFRGRAQAAAP